MALRKGGRGNRSLSLESLESRNLMTASVQPVLMVLADQQDFYYREYSDTRLSLEAAGVEVVVAATTTNPTVPHQNTGEGNSSGEVVPDIALAEVDADQYSAIVFVGGWGSSMYQYAFAETGNHYDNDHYNGDATTRQAVNDLINEFVAQDKYVAAICNGTTVLAWARVDGVSPLAGRQVAVPFVGTPAMYYGGEWYPNFYERGQYDMAVANGALANTVSGQRGDPTTVADDVVVDGRIITGENYDSALYFGQVIAEQVLAAAAPPAPVFQVGSNLIVQGTSDADTIYLWSGASAQQVFAWRNGQSFGPYLLPVGGRVIVHAGDGNDRVYATDLLVGAVLNGEGGHDQLTDGAADDDLFGRDGVVRVLDVGLARAVDERTPGLTGAGSLMGTVDYMAPEQAEDPRRADARSDVYSLGCTLYFLLTGSPPYASGTACARLLAHSNAPIPSARSSRATVPAALDQVVQWMMAKQPAARPVDMTAALAAFDSGAPPSRRITRRALLATVGSCGLAGVAAYLGFRRVGILPEPVRVPFDGRSVQSRWARALGVPAEVEYPAGLKLSLIPPGSFVLGTPDAVIQRQASRASHPHERAVILGERQRDATIQTPFYLGRTEVTVDQFRRFVEATRSRYVTFAERATSDEEGGWGWHPRDGWRRRKGCSWRDADQLALSDDHPAGNVTWDDAVAYCRWLSAELGTACRLPTEEEWEFACRAGSDGLWCYGNDEATLATHAWVGENSGGVFHPVGDRRANAFGLFDMHGNLGEWAAAPEQGAAPTEDEVGPLASEYRPVRGGQFLSTADRARCGARHWEHRNTLGPGLRVVIALPDEALSRS